MWNLIVRVLDHFFFTFHHAHQMMHTRKLLSSETQNAETCCRKWFTDITVDNVIYNPALAGRDMNNLTIAFKLVNVNRHFEEKWNGSQASV